MKSWKAKKHQFTKKIGFYEKKNNLGATNFCTDVMWRPLFLKAPPLDAWSCCFMSILLLSIVIFLSYSYGTRVKASFGGFLRLTLLVILVNYFCLQHSFFLFIKESRMNIFGGSLVTFELTSLIPLVGSPDGEPPSCEAPQQLTIYTQPTIF